jgi:integrase
MRPTRVLPFSLPPSGISRTFGYPDVLWTARLPGNPVKLVRRPPVPRGRTRRFQDGEEQRLLDACDCGRTALLRPLIILAIETAMRWGELLDLRWQHIDFKLNVAHLPLTKNGESRDIPLSRQPFRRSRKCAQIAPITRVGCE